MFNVLVATRVWAKLWQHKKLTIFCDNEAVVHVLNTGKTRHDLLATISRNIFMICAENDISLNFKHIEGKKNVIADLLSRWQSSKEDFEKLSTLAPNVEWCIIEGHHTFLDVSI